MRFHSHLSFGVFCVQIFSNVNFDFLGIAVGIFFSILPDIDKFNSWISKRTRPLSFLFNLFKHRGVTHSLWVPILIFLFKPPFFDYMLVGYLSHFLLDIFSDGGIKPFYPNNYRFKINLGPIFELVVFFGTVIVNVFLILTYI
jgi:membrane-bound metal-dependent hydrolase YbcI (DUF457 family)